MYTEIVPSFSHEQQARALIEAIDLRMVKRKLIESETDEKWSQEQATRAETLYRQFLFLCWKYQASVIVPTKTIDRFWHQHILDTRAYAQDCEHIFGRFVHHNPYFGMRGEDDKRANRDAFALTQKLWVKEFDETITGVGVDCGGSGYCDAGCGKITDCATSSCQPTFF